MTQYTETSINTPVELFRRTSLSVPDQEAVLDTRRNKRFTYRELQDYVCGLVDALCECGVGRQETYVPVVRNGIKQTSAILTPSVLGPVANRVNYRQSPDTVTHILSDSKAQTIIFDEVDRDTGATVRDNLANCQQPKSVELVEKLPRSATEKAQKFKIEETINS